MICFFSCMCNETRTLFRSTRWTCAIASCWDHFCMQCIASVWVCCLSPSSPVVGTTKRPSLNPFCSSFNFTLHFTSIRCLCTINGNWLQIINEMFIAWALFSMPFKMRTDVVVFFSVCMILFGLFYWGGVSALSNGQTSNCELKINDLE